MHKNLRIGKFYYTSDFPENLEVTTRYTRITNELMFVKQLIPEILTIFSRETISSKEEKIACSIDKVVF